MYCEVICLSNENFNNEYENLFDSSENNDTLISSNNSDLLDLNSFAEPEQQDKVSAKRNTDFSPQKKIKKFLNKKVLKLALIAFLCLVIIGCASLGGLVLYIYKTVDASIVEDLDKLGLKYTTTIYSQNNDGKWVEYQRIHGTYNRIWVDYDKDLAELEDPDYFGIPKTLADAFIAVEDKRFYEHKGVDWRRTASAVLGVIKRGSTSGHGGSSITQQLVRNITDDRDRAISRKIREIFRAINLEKSYSKEVILESYMNTIAMGNGIYGVAVASEYYFGKSVNELTISECASLAGITNLPEYYRPDTNFENNLKRRNTILKLMLDQEYITQEEYDNALAEELNVVANSSVVRKESINNYFVDTLIDDVVVAFMDEYGYDKDQATQKIYTGGYKIYSTVKPKIQTIMDKVYSNPNYILTAKDGSKLQGSMTVMDYKGHVVGIVGGMGEKTENRGLNRATMSPRQPGSSIKPLSAYAPAIENNLITYSTIIDDSRKSYGGWYPTNHYNSYLGKVTVEKALAYSINTAAVHVIDLLSPKVSYNFLTERLGMKYLNENDIAYAPLGMGGMNKGVTTLESAAAFAIFGNGGKYYEPTTFLEVYDQYDNLIISKTPQPTVAISEDTATIVNKLLQQVVYGPDGTGRYAASAVSNMKIFGKTGTSNSYNNIWFAGGSPYYVGASWCGYDSETRISNSNQAKYMWTDVMRQIHSGLRAKDFNFSNYVQCKVYCSETGLLANSGCPVNGYGWYKTRNQKYCTTHSGEPLTGTSESEAQNYLAGNKDKVPSNDSSVDSSGNNSDDSLTSSSNSEEQGSTSSNSTSSVNSSSNSLPTD